MLAQPWPQWSEAEIDALKLGYLNDIIACKEGYGAFAALAFFALLALWYVQSLPNRADGAKPADEPAPAGETAAALNG